MVLAVASGNISRLPKSGEWMEWIRRLFGVVLLAMAAYFLRTVIGDHVYYAILGALLVIGGVMLGFVSRVQSTSLWFVAFRRLVGVVAPLYGLYMALAPGHILGRTHARRQRGRPTRRARSRAPRRTGAPSSSISPPTGACRARSSSTRRSVSPT